MNNSSRKKSIIIGELLFGFVLQCIQRENVQLKLKMGAKLPESLVIYIYVWGILMITVYYNKNDKISYDFEFTKLWKICIIRNVI